MVIWNRQISDILISGVICYSFIVDYTRSLHEKANWVRKPKKCQRTARKQKCGIRVKTESAKGEGNKQKQQNLLPSSPPPKCQARDKKKFVSDLTFVLCTVNLRHKNRIAQQMMLWYSDPILFGGSHPVGIANLFRFGSQRRIDAEILLILQDAQYEEFLQSVRLAA